MAILGLELQTSEFILSHNPALVSSPGEKRQPEQEIKVLGLCLHTNKGSGREAGNCSDNSEYNKLIQHVKKKRFVVRKLVFLD